MQLLVGPFWVDLRPAFAIEVAGYFAKKALIGIVPVDLIEFCLKVLGGTAIEALAVFDETPSPDLKSSGLWCPLIENNLIVNESSLRIVEMIKLDQIHILVGGSVAFK